MRWAEILARLNQVSLGNFGAGWVPKEADAVVARRVIRFLEDRRMLFNDCAQEDIRECVGSAEKIRTLLTEELGKLKEDSPLLPYFRAIRASARQFMERFPNYVYHRFSQHDLSLQEMALLIYLGQLRNEIGLQVALIAARWQIDVEHDLARVLPKLGE